MLLTRENVVYSYVIEDSEHKKITDLYSFTIVPLNVASKAKGVDHVNVSFT